MDLLLPPCLAALILSAAAGNAAPCGEPFPNFLRTLTQGAIDGGLIRAAVKAFFKNARRGKTFPIADQNQGAFRNALLECPQRSIGNRRAENGDAAPHQFTIFRAVDRDSDSKERTHLGLPTDAWPKNMLSEAL